MGKGNGRMKCLIIQPHSDDAILSCFKFMTDEDFLTKVLTVEKNDKRLSEDKALSKFIGVKYMSLGVEVMDDYYSEFFKVYGRDAVLSDDNVIPFYKERFGKDKIKELRKVLKSKVLEYIERGYMILCPMGVGHPFHYLVRYLLRKIESGFVFYREFPHSYKRKAKKQLEDCQRGFDLLSIFDEKEDNAIKYQLAQKFYKSQSGFFFYEHANVEKLLPEEFYVYKDEESEETINASAERHIKIYVISKGRPNGKTFDFLHRANEPYTVVVEPQDEKAYREAGHENILVLPENDRGFSYTVNYSKNQYDGKNPVVIMDDDICNFFYSVEGEAKISLSLKTGEELHEFFVQLNKQILETDFDIGTIGKSAFDWNTLDVSPRLSQDGARTRYSGLPVVIIINNKKLLKMDFDETLCFKSDIDYALKCMYLGFRYAKFVKFLQQTRMNKDGKQAGGLAETYKKIEKITHSQDVLLKRWPDNIVIDPKKKPNNGIPELRIIYKVSDNEPAVINECRKLLNL